MGGAGGAGGSSVGTIRVNTSTSGASPDPSYTVSIAGRAKGTIGPNALKDYSVLAGSRIVLLGDIAGNCTVSSTNAQIVNVGDGGTATVTFNVDCPRSRHSCWASITSSSP